ncbi:phosphoenolpyruvate--protein phosphotransferase [Shewanella schlegeliana]|uniref:Phosphoenolpyruvate-protein phosphotransferase n=1 Tax=Shewanella schlegeliana TaxID=190308 RepID=A0ABS1T0M4_9GAMM|nr:phosphoenolpyruvate--protein phosphotransferase [Shewanella schlegeliana]MBL4913805.1 phosphoenolpyruvate--protein phosphotransferase [Shewanella schlegeliana]MCL1108810.1 phosphoenolpyruvate--protein phosphotransferase [Shewanella schlegeliana]GIU25931.1 phosphoenolpyruvate-protein phosphotransferase [Shewanella schlegeliana]
MSITGIVVSSGIAFGHALHLNLHHEKIDYRVINTAQIPIEIQKLKKAFELQKHHLHQVLIKLEPKTSHFELIEADILLLEDEELLSQIEDAISTLQIRAAAAIERIFAHQASELEQLEDPYLANRAQDMLCLSHRLIARLNGAQHLDVSQLKQDTIIFAHDLTPAEFAMLPLDYINGLVLNTGGITSHTAILARSAGIPALLSCEYEQANIENGAQVVLNAIDGELVVEPSDENRVKLTQLMQHDVERKQQLLTLKDLPTETLDGHSVSLLANVGSLNEISHLADVGAEGIGLFRTEFMLMNTSTLPDEKTQYHFYCDALHLMEGKTFTIRTLDVGADKELPCLTPLIEDNPALGIRGIRYSLANPELFNTQVKAILRAANHGAIRLMFPMINQVEELEALFGFIEECKLELIEEEKGFGELSYGIVVETPAAVLNLSSMLPLLDFISIGTNDLTQYTMAADRTNPSLTKTYPSLSPAVLQLIKTAIDHARENNIKVSLCGELASDPKVAPLLVGMGIDELSVNLSSLLEVKSGLRDISYQTCLTLAKHALKIKRIEELYLYINGFK